MDNILPTALKDKPHLVAYDTTFNQRLSEVDLSILLPELIDTAPAAALPYLADINGVSGFNGWRYADTEEKQRALLKKGIAINKTKGTDLGILNGLKQIGINSASIVKGQYKLYCNGEQFVNGSFNCGGKNPFTIQIQISSMDFPTITPQIAIDMLAIIATFKAARDLLVSIDVKMEELEEENDSITLLDELSITVDNSDTSETTTYTL